MKYIKLFFILILVISCSNKKQIVEFENVLGKENSQTLTYLVSDFENDFLKSNYPDKSIEKAYELFLIELKNGQKEKKWKKLSQESRNVFEKSTLRLEKYSFPDSIWIENQHIIHKRFPYKRNDSGTKYYSQITRSQFIPKRTNMDSLIESELNDRILNEVGKYWVALDSISDGNEFLKEYLKITLATGGLDPKISASQILNSKLDYSDYFNKRIIVMEYAY